MAINFSPKVGEILECNFGNYPVSQNGPFSTTYYDGRIPPEMIKNRLVVVLNGKLMATHASSFHYQPLATRQVKTWNAC
ncbi:yifN [Escherichia coli]|uniref:YifN n=1 Tax=Escherichia coli TaxID=562 RepID=A0A377B5Z3_ECOLX|nr:yifN [Escherichia coli]